MADRKNLARELGRGVGSAVSNTDNAYFVDWGDGTFGEVIANRVYVKQSGVWVAWDGSLAAGVAVLGHVITDTGSVIAATLSAETTKVIGTVNIAAAQTVALSAGAAVIGHVINDASSAVIGHVIVDSGVITTVSAVTAITNALPAGSNVIGHVIADSGSVTAASGDTAAGSSDAGNPVKIGGVGRTTNPTAVTDGQRVNASFDKLGKQVVVGSIRALKTNEYTQISSSTTETTIVAAQGANVFADLYGLLITNTSATGTKVTLKDDTSGTTRWVGYVPATDIRGFTLAESAAIKQAVANKPWTLTCTTSVAAIEVTALTVANL